MKTYKSQLHLETLDARELPSATVVNLTTRGSSGEVNGAIFRQDDGQPNAPGGNNQFLRLRGAGPGDERQGYNTDARPLQFGEDRNFTHSLRVGDLPRVFDSGTAYRSFLLNIRQDASHPRLSLDQVRLYTAETGNLRGYNRNNGRLAGHAPVYDLDAGGNSWVRLNDRLNARNSFGDMVMLVPESAFAGTTDNSFVYLYCKFGEHNEAHGGRMEWAPGRAPTTPTATATISGSVFNIDTGGRVGNMLVYIDADNNGSRDAGEIYTYADDEAFYTFSDLAVNATGTTLFRLRIDTTGTNYTPASDDPVEVNAGPGDILTDINLYVRRVGGGGGG